MALPTGGLISAEICWDTVPDRDAFPFSIPSISAIDALDLSSAVTFLIGENGSGKSTLLEAIAIAAGLNAEGGTRNLVFSNHSTESDLHDHLRLVWRTRQRWAFFLRAETFFDTASAYAAQPDDALSGLHQRSHGEQFIDAAMEKLSPGGLHLLDEPESALSLIGQLELMRRIHDVAARDGQFVIATHSPILLALPGARIYELTAEGAQETDFDSAEPVRLTRSFLEAPDRFLHHLLTNDPD